MASPHYFLSDIFDFSQMRWIIVKKLSFIVISVQFCFIEAAQKATAAGQSMDYDRRKHNQIACDPSAHFAVYSASAAPMAKTPHRARLFMKAGGLCAVWPPFLRMTGRP